jgi:hypothetical protein
VFFWDADNNFIMVFMIFLIGLNLQP